MRASFQLPFAQAPSAPAGSVENAGNADSSAAADAAAGRDGVPARTTGADIRAFIDGQGAAGAADGRADGLTVGEGSDQADEAGTGAGLWHA